MLSVRKLSGIFHTCWQHYQLRCLLFYCQRAVFNLFLKKWTNIQFKSKDIEQLASQTICKWTASWKVQVDNVRLNLPGGERADKQGIGVETQTPDR